MSEMILDTSAILAVMFKEPGMEKVVPFLPAACTSASNRTEALSIIAKCFQCSTAHEAEKLYQPLKIETIPFDQRQSNLAVDICIRSRTLGLSTGDCACLALAVDKGLPVLTADKAWAKLDIEVDVQLIR